ncbi:YheC/YheD family endospore coat-associated protein [Niallia sp. 01092]|uniref:YheC/YheD family endospore coat-associated protein n=1 Tax=unclassified Niallia TaxID=2837522 RepID=UPI003FD67778
MSLIGMLHYQKHPEQVTKAYAFAAVAKMEGIDFFYFSYSGVDFEHGKINGWIYESGKWIQKELPFPAVIINTSSPKTKTQKTIQRRLKKMSIFTSYPVGNKMKVYRKLLEDGKYTQNLIPSYEMSNEEEVFDLLCKYIKIVMKPLSGNQGKGIYFIQKEAEDSHRIIEGEKNYLYTKEELTYLLQKLIKEQKYLMQPFIESKTKAGLAYDFRIHVQKNGEGDWEINLIYPRISGNAKLVSNVSSGGYRGDFISFLMEEYEEGFLEIKQTIEHFALSFASHFDLLYPYSFDELGIDVGLDKNKALWIYEVNWRPGSKHREFAVAKLLIPYCMYLANN